MVICLYRPVPVCCADVTNAAHAIKCGLIGFCCFLRSTVKGNGHYTSLNFEGFTCNTAKTKIVNGVGPSNKQVNSDGSTIVKGLAVSLQLPRAVHMERKP